MNKLPGLYFGDLLGDVEDKQLQDQEKEKLALQKIGAVAIANVARLSVWLSDDCVVLILCAFLLPLPCCIDMCHKRWKQLFAGTTIWQFFLRFYDVK